VAFTVKKLATILEINISPRVLLLVHPVIQMRMIDNQVTI